MKETKVPMTIQVTPAERDAFRQAAEKDVRTLSSWCRVTLAKGVSQGGDPPMEPLHAIADLERQNLS